MFFKIIMTILILGGIFLSLPFNCSKHLALCVGPENVIPGTVYSVIFISGFVFVLILIWRGDP